MSTPRISIDERLRRSSAAKIRVVGERRPDETGMLRMLPLGEGREPPPEEPSATTFFRVDAPKERARPAIVPVPRPAPAPSPSPPPVIRGPVASVGAPKPVEPHPEGRIRSLRVLALLSSVFFLMGVLVLVTAAVLVGTHRYTTLDAPAPPPVPHPLVLPEEPAEDTGTPTGEEGPIAPPHPHAPPVPHPSTPQQAAKPSDRVTVRFSGTPLPSLVELTCPGTERQRLSLVGGAATASGLPNGAECQLFPKGALVATMAPVSVGRTYDCHIEGTTTTCR
jgi:hypothetical protein